MASSSKNRRGTVSRRDFLRATGALGSGAVLSGYVGACTTGPDPSAAGRAAPSPSATGSSVAGSVTGGLAEALLDLDPHTGFAGGTITANIHIFEALYRVDKETLASSPELAANGLEQVSDTVYRVTIREGATFHSGDPVTADDIVFTFDRIADPDVGSAIARYAEIVNDVRAVDDSTVELTLNAPTTLLAERLAVIKVMSRAAVTGQGGEELGLRPVGTGPYRATNVASNETAELRRHDDYNGDRPALLERIDLDVLLDDNARIAALEANQAQLIEDPPIQDVERINASPSLEATALPSIDLKTIVLCHCGKPPFDDVRVRQALHYAIDRPAIRDSVLFGEAQDAEGALSTNHPGYVAPSTVYTHDPERARSLLNDAGYANGVDFELLVSNLGWIGPQAPLLTDQLEQAGFRATVRLGETESLYSSVLDGSYTAYLAPTDPSAVGGYDTEFLLRWLYYGLVPRSFCYWEAPEADELERLLDQALRATSDEQRDGRLGAAQQLIAEQVPIFPVHFRSAPTAWSSQEIEGFVPQPILNLELFDVRAR